VKWLETDADRFAAPCRMLTHMQQIGKAADTTTSVDGAAHKTRA